MTIFRTATLLAGLLLAQAAHAQLAVKIGVLNDQSGPYADVTGDGSVIAARLAVEDFQPGSHGMAVEVVVGDHQNKPDVGTTLVRQWIDVGGVDVIADVPTSSVALAVSEVVRQKNRILLVSGGGTSDLTGKACSPNTIQWTYDSWAAVNGVASATVRTGGDTWFFLTADYAYGTAAQADATAAVLKAGGRVLGSVRAPFPTTDFSSYLLQAQGSGSKVVALANAGPDTINSIKQASEFGIAAKGQRLVALLMFLNDVHALGLESVQGLSFTQATYWDLNEATRAFAARYRALRRGQAPNDVHMGVYASVMHYLKAVAAAGAKDAGTVIRQMKATPIDDPFFGQGRIRADGRAIHPMYLVAAKRPEESTSAWDLLKIVATIPADQAFRPIEGGGCSLTGG